MDKKDKKEKKDQFIIAYVADFERSDVVLSYAIFLAQKLRKGLILLHICDPKYSGLSPDEAEPKLQRLRDDTISSLNSLPDAPGVTYAAIKGDTRQVVSALPQLIGAVAVVACVDRHVPARSPLSRRSLLRNFADCKTAFLVAQRPLASAADMAHVAMSVDFKKESKDKFIWSTYFPRFAGSSMHMLHYDYRDQFLRTKWKANMQQLGKLYGELGITFSDHVIPSRSAYMDVNALRFAAQQKYGLLIAVTTKEKDGLEFFIGTQERRTIVNKELIPILFLNPREDLYVLCD